MAKQKTIIVTGAGGLVGSHLVRQILRDGHRCVAVVRPGASGVKALPAGVETVEVDLDRAGAVASADLPSVCDAVVHLAQSNGYRNLPYEAGSVFQVNVVSLAALLEYARGAGASHFVYASTGSVYAPTDDALTESSSVITDGSGRNLYPWSKLTGEAVLHSYAEHLHAITLRYFFVYGAGANAGMLIPRTVERVRAGEAVGLQGEEGCVIVPTHADDAAAACLKSLQLEQSTLINVAGPEGVSLRAIANAAGEQLGRQPEFTSMDGEPPVFRVDISQLRKALGVEPIDFSAGLERTLQSR